MSASNRFLCRQAIGQIRTCNCYKDTSCCWCNSVLTTQIYAKITNQKVDVDMKILFSRIENRYELAKDDLTEDFFRISTISTPLLLSAI